MSSTYYDISTGRGMARSFSGNGGPRGDDSVGRIEGFYALDTLYFPGGVPTARAAINYSIDKPTIVAAGGEVATITGLPANATIYFGVDEYSADASGSFTFDANSVGEFEFVINEPEYLVTKITITAT